VRFLAVFFSGALATLLPNSGETAWGSYFSGGECLKRKYIIKRKNVEPKKEVNDEKPQRGGVHTAVERLDEPPAQGS